MNSKLVHLILVALSVMVVFAAPLSAAEPEVVNINGEPPDSVQVEGSRMVISADGAINVMERNGDEWEQVARLVPPGEDRVGGSVALHGDRIAVGVSFEDVGGQVGAGAIYVFEEVDGEWQFMQRITAEEPLAGYGMGHALAMDGDAIIAGARYTDTTDPEGKVYIFEYDDQRDYWQQVARFDERPEYLPFIGAFVSLDDSTAATSVYSEGLVWLFERDEAGWYLTEEFQLSDANASKGARAGRPIISGNAMIVTFSGYYSADAEYSYSRGLIYVLERDESGEWQEVAQLRSPDYENLEFGRTAAFHNGLLATMGREKRIYLFTANDGEWQLAAAVDVPQVPDAYSLGTRVQALSDEWLVLRGENGALVYALEDIVPEWAANNDADSGDDSSSDGDDNPGNDDSGNSGDDDSGNNGSGNDNETGDDDSQGVGGNDDASGGSDEDSGDDGGAGGADGDADGDADGNDDSSADAGSETESEDEAEPEPSRGGSGGGLFAWLVAALLPLRAMRAARSRQ